LLNVDITLVIDGDSSSDPSSRGMRGSALARRPHGGDHHSMSTIPAFSLAGSDGRTWSDQDFRGRTWILYFYPKDSTPGCTTEACDFRDAAQDLARAGLTVVGVSPDSIASHQRFIAKQGLNFLLLSDPSMRWPRRWGCG
jgi:peroxiredoxin